MLFRSATIVFYVILTGFSASGDAPQKFVSEVAGYSFTVPSGWQVASDPHAANASLGIVNLLCGMSELTNSTPRGAGAIMVEATHFSASSLDTPEKFLNARRDARQTDSNAALNRSGTTIGGLQVEVLQYDVPSEEPEPTAASAAAPSESVPPPLAHVTDVSFMLDKQLMWIQLTDHGCPAAADALATVVQSLRRVP
jgi:hypothetical protein